MVSGQFAAEALGNASCCLVACHVHRVRRCSIRKGKLRMARPAEAHELCCGGGRAGVAAAAAAAGAAAVSSCSEQHVEGGEAYTKIGGSSFLRQCHRKAGCQVRVSGLCSMSRKEGAAAMLWPCGVHCVRLPVPD